MILFGNLILFNFLLFGLNCWLATVIFILTRDVNLIEIIKKQWKEFCYRLDNLEKEGLIK